MTRSIAASLALVLVWYVAVRPAVMEVRGARAMIEAQSEAIEHHHASADGRSVSTAGLLERVEEAGEALEEDCELARDAAHLYETVNGLAREHGVRVERIEPGTSGSRTSARAKAKLTDHVSYSISVTGSYADVARFVSDVADDTGITKVSSLRLSPSPVQGAPDAVRATIDTLHFRPKDGFLAVGKEDGA